MRDQAVAGDRPPGGDRGADAVLLAVLAEVDAPGEGGDDHVDRRIGRVEAEAAIAAKGERPDVAGAELVAADQLAGRRGELLGRVGKLQVAELGRLGEAVEVIGMAEHRRPPLGPVTANALEDARPVVQAVREHMDLGVLPRYELAVLPDQLRRLHDGKVCLTGPIPAGVPLNFFEGRGLLALEPRLRKSTRRSTPTGIGSKRKARPRPRRRSL